MQISDFFSPCSVYDRFCRHFKPRPELSRPHQGRIRRPAQRFNKYPFQIIEKTATILRKEDPSVQRIRSDGNHLQAPRVRIVSRHEDTEFVECLECGEVFDSEEFRDMEIEETAETEDVADEE